MDDEPITSLESPTRSADGALAAAVLVLAVVAIRVGRIDVPPSAVLLGAGSTVGFELLAGRDPERVRRVWARRGVRATVVVATLLVGALAVAARAAWLVVAGAGALAVAARAAWLIVAGAGALGCYLVVLALVAWGIVPPPRSWTVGP